MIDIIKVPTETGGDDIGLFDTQTTKAANILNVQLGALEYAPNLGIDLKYFLSDEFKFQNASFKAYMIEILANNGINVSSVIDIMEDLFSVYTFNIKSEETNSGLIAR